MPTPGICEEARQRRQGVLAVVIAVLLTLVVLNNLTLLSPAPLRPTDSKGRSRVTPRSPLPQFGEKLAGWLSPTLTVDLLTHGTKKAPVWRLRVTRDHVVARYMMRPLPPHPLDMAREGGGTMGSNLSCVRDFFAYLKAPRGRCRKQVMVGGRHQCGEVADDIPDGRKVVCLDAALQLQPRRRTHSCLTLSFGIHRDTSFDAAMAALNCEVHMFDLLDYTPASLLRRAPNAHFHQVGLAEGRLQRYYLNLGREVPVDSLEGHLDTNNLMYQPIHLLKMDIEGDEWVVLNQVAKQPVMDLIGQIAIEIHSENLLTLPAEEHLSYLQAKYDVLRAIESRGFEKIAYWDNTKSKVYNDTSGSTYSTCGEIHFVNTNWYNASFKSTLKNMGIHFL